MSLAFGGLNAAFSDFASPGVSARGIDIGAKSYPVLHPRQNSTEPAPNTVNLFFDSAGKDWGFAASVVEVCADQTVLALQCTSKGSDSSNLVGTADCGPNAEKITATFASTTFHISSAVTTSSLGTVISATAVEGCALRGTTAALCSVTIGGKADNKKYTTSTTISYGSTARPTYHRNDVAITAGAEKTASPAATCASKPSAASATNTKNMMVWGLAGVATGLLTLL